MLNNNSSCCSCSCRLRFLFLRLRRYSSKSASISPTPSVAQGRCQYPTQHGINGPAHLLHHRSSPKKKWWCYVKWNGIKSVDYASGISMGRLVKAYHHCGILYHSLLHKKEMNRFLNNSLTIRYQGDESHVKCVLMYVNSSCRYVRVELTSAVRPAVVFC